MQIINRKLEIVNCFPNKISLEVFEKLNVVIDTEFCQHDKSRVLSLMAHDSFNDLVLFFSEIELNYNFDLISRLFDYYGFKFDYLTDNEIESILTRCTEISEEIFEVGTKMDFKNSRLCELMTEYGLANENIKVKKTDYDRGIYVKPRSVEVDFIFFYQVADMFKICGDTLQRLYLNSNLEQFRVVKFKNRQSVYAKIDGKLIEISVQLRDRFHTIPPQKNRSLDGNAISLGVGTSKINLKNPEIARELGVSNIMENMDILALKNPKLFRDYACQDVFVTRDVAQKQQQLLDTVCNALGIEPLEIRDTVGSNVNQIILALMRQYFKIGDNKDYKKLLTHQISLSHITNLQNVPQTDFGCQPFLTVGGLLFSRTPNLPLISGTLSDCDLSSCYASKMSQMNIYLGEPVVKTFKYQSQKPKLDTVLETLKSMNVARDAWFVRVSGEFKQVINTILLSDLKFTPTNLKLKTLTQQLKSTPNRKSVEKFDATKTSKTMATSRILTKEVKFGVVTSDIFDAISTLPQSWVDEFLDLDVDAITFYPPELIVDNINELETLKLTLPNEPYKLTLVKNSLQTVLESQYYKNNASLRFDIGKYWSEIKKIRSKFKKEKNPVQELFKLIGNSGYGVLACQNLTCNNSVAANVITGNARATSWLMTMSLNGFAPITDGTCFGWKSIPIGLKFRDLVSKNPNYVQSFEKFDNKLTNDQIIEYSGDIERFLKTHQQSFFEVDNTFEPIKTYGYELKTEIFKNSDGSDLETVFFSKYYNSNAGNYCKSIDSDALLIDDTDENFQNQYKSVKARSFKSSQSLVEWYCESLIKYQQPYEYTENKIIKFSDGNKLAIKVLNTLQDGEKIIHPMGLSTNAFKCLKLVSSSQFLFQTEKQLRNFETNENVLFEVSKKLLTRSFFETFQHDEKRVGVDYYQFSKTHPVGIGLEFLALLPKFNGSIACVRESIHNAIKSGKTDFNASLNISRSLKYVEKFKDIFVSIVIKKCNAEIDLINVMRASVGDNTLLTLGKENIKTLEQILAVEDD
jgi:hypothetical protein